MEMCIRDRVVNEKNETVFVTRELETKEKQEMYKTEEEARKNYDGYEGAYLSLIHISRKKRKK